MVRYFLLLLLIISFTMSCQKPTPIPKEALCLTTEVPQKPNMGYFKRRKYPTVKFLVTADPQYDREQMNPDFRLTRTADTILMIAKRRIQKEGFRGLLISGDLTHNARFEELERYQELTKDIVPYLYDGLGNHDFRKNNGEFFDSLANSRFGFEQMLEGEPFGWHNGSLKLFEYVRDHPRNTPINSSYPNIHYSWDWNDLHFVHVNLAPANVPRQPKPLQHPFQAYDFLKQDLKKHVGNSGRPVILLHHYGLDPFSRGIKEDGHLWHKAQWWSVEEQKAYWQLLADYNVIGIFTGHAHRCQGCDGCYLPWDGENIGRTSVTRKPIPTFVAGAAREGYYMDVTVSYYKMVVNRYEKEKLISHYELPLKRKVVKK